MVSIWSTNVTVSNESFSIDIISNRKMENQVQAQTQAQSKQNREQQLKTKQQLLQQLMKASPSALFQIAKWKIKHKHK